MKQHEGWGDRTDGSRFLREGQKERCIPEKGLPGSPGAQYYAVVTSPTLGVLLGP